MWLLSADFSMVTLVALPATLKLEKLIIFSLSLAAAWCMSVSDVLLSRLVMSLLGLSGRVFMLGLFSVAWLGGEY